MEAELASVFDGVLTRLQRAVADRRAAWRLPVLATYCPERGPQGRTVVLRSMARAPLSLDVFTDARTRKVAEIGGETRVSLVFWDKSASLQLRIDGAADVLKDGEAVEAARRRLGDYAGADYARAAIPGSAASGPDDAEERLADGLAHFCLLRVTATRMDWLELGRDGHRRAEFACGKEPGQWTGHWTVP